MNYTIPFQEVSYLILFQIFPDKSHHHNVNKITCFFITASCVWLPPPLLTFDYFLVSNGQNGWMLQNNKHCFCVFHGIEKQSLF